MINESKLMLVLLAAVLSHKGSEPRWNFILEWSPSLQMKKLMLRTGDFIYINKKKKKNIHAGVALYEDLHVVTVTSYWF